MKINLKNLDHRNIGSVVTWRHESDGLPATTTTKVLGFTHDHEGTVLHTPLGSHCFAGDEVIDVQLSKQSVLLAQLLTELEDQG